jgi:hypothetical protein
MSYGNYGGYPQAPAGRVSNGEGPKLAKQSWIYGLVGFFIFGIILGPIAIHKARQAKALGSDATLGLVLGIIDTVFAAIFILTSLSRVLS